MRSQVRHAIVVVALLAVVATGRANAQTWDFDDLRAFSGLTADQWNAVDRGDPQARVLETQEKREVAVVGVAHLRATTPCFVAQLQDIENFKKNPAVLRIRKFVKFVAARDLEGFSLEPGDLAALRNCRLGDCNVKLPIAAIERLGRDVDWSRPDYAARAQSIFREELLAYVEDYLNRGNSALIEYRDKNKPVRLEDEFRAVLDARPGLSGLVPELHDYLAKYPSEPLPGVSEFFYWSTESFGLKPVASITHVSIYVQPGRAVVASKQIYASHYFDASLGLTAALDDPGEASPPGMYLVYVNRSRIDFLSGFFGGLRRALARGRLRDGMRRNLAEAVRKLESSCAEYPKDIPDALSFDQLSLDFAERF
ncbi:MAG: hypothetical protein LAO55_28410 [Acidobacteriia bacterium]|nr:hypothetical protein [Terriglobia bacterium]